MDHNQNIDDHTGQTIGCDAKGCQPEGHCDKCHGIDDQGTHDQTEVQDIHELRFLLRTPFRDQVNRNRKDQDKNHIEADQEVTIRKWILSKNQHRNQIDDQG